MTKALFLMVDIVPHNGPHAALADPFPRIEEWGGAGWHVEAIAGPAGVTATATREPTDDSVATMFDAPRRHFFASWEDIAIQGGDVLERMRRDISGHLYDTGDWIQPDHG